MKLFWAVIVIFIAAAAFVLFAQSRSPQPTTHAATEREAVPSTRESEESVVEEPASALFALIEDDEALDETDTAAEVVQPRRDREEEARELAEDLWTSSEADNDADDLDGNWLTSDGGGFDDHAHNPDALQTAENPWAVEGELPLGDERLAAQRLEHSIVEQEDGSLLVDDSFLIRGQGTEADPYEITWDLLMSAAETYQPRLGMEDIPERVAMLDGKHVKISGYLMFPMITGQADELLVMLNMWDGCCIGTMPSPYDAIEVQLGTPASMSGSQQYFNYGSIRGTLQIDPYLINDWLIGLYLIDDAELDVSM